VRQILHSVHIHAAPSAVYDALTTAAGLRGWWTSDVAITDSVIRFSFAGDFNPQMKQTALKPQLIEWRCVGGHENWKDNTFRFALTDRHGETLVMFLQDYARELSDEIYGNYNFNWGYYLNSLKRFCETGAGTPFSAAH